MRQLKKHTTSAVLLLLGFGMGRAYDAIRAYGQITALAAVQRYVDVQTRVNVLVVQPYSDFKVEVRLDGDVRNYIWEWCPDSATRLHVGEKFEYATYDQRANCKSFNGPPSKLGFQLYTNKITGENIIFPVEEVANR